MPSSVAPVLPLILVSVLAAGASSATVGLWPTTTTTTTTPTTTPPAADDGTGARLERGVVEVAELVLKERLRRLTTDDVARAGGGPGCLAEQGCRARTAAKLGVEELAHVEVALTGSKTPWANAHLTVWQADGAVAFDDTQAVATDRDLRGLLTRAFDPARATARLDVTGLATGDTLLIDGLPSDARSLLAPGAHTVTVLHDDGTRTTMPLTLAFEEHRVVAVEGRLPPGAVAPWPGLVPAVVGGAVVAAGLVGAGAGLWVAATPVDLRQRDVAVVATLAASSIALLGAVTVVGAFLPAPARSPEVQP